MLTVNTLSAKFEYLTFVQLASNEHFIKIQSGTPVFSHCVIKEYGSSIGIHISGKNTNPRISHCLITDCKTGILVQNGGAGIIEECEFTEHSKAAIGITSRANPTIKKCSIHDNHGGIYINDSGKGVIRENLFYDNDRGD